MNKSINWKEISKGKVSTWKDKVKFRRLNKKWLGYSAEIAKRISALISDSDALNQAKLSEKLEVTPQYISKVLKGQENLSLETIGKLSDALGFELISFPEYKYSRVFPETQPTYKDAKAEISDASATASVKATSNARVVTLSTNDQQIQVA